MQLHPTSRSRRVRRLLAVSAAAVAVMIAPTACNYGGPAQMDMPSHSGHMDGMNMDDPAQPGAPEEHQVVPVANQVPATAAPEADDAATRPPPTAARSRDDRRRGDDDRRGDGAATGRRRPRRPRRRPAPRPTSTTADRDRLDAPRQPRAPAAGAVGARRAADGTTTACDVLGRDCSTSKLTPHDGFQNSPACVSTADGRDRRGEQAAVAADHRRAPDRRGQPAVHSSRSAPATWCATGSSAPPRAATTWRARSSTARACSAATSTPRAGSCRRPARRPTRATPRSSSSPPQDDGGGATPDTVTIDVARRSRPPASCSAPRGPVTDRTARR